MPPLTMHNPKVGRRATRLRAPIALAAVLATVTGGAIASPAAAADPTWQTLTATSADAFVDTVGVNVHLGYDDTIYADQARTLRLLKDLGVRHVRDGLVANYPNQHAALRGLRDNGIKASLIVDPAGRFGTGLLADGIAALKDPNRLLGVAATLEGPNELDCGGWNDDVRRQQHLLATSLEAEPTLRDIPLLGPSWCQGSRSVTTYGNDGSDSDAWNIHPYAGGYMPEANMTGGQFNPDLNAEGQAAQAREVEDQPVYGTELGYHTAVNHTGGHRPTSERAVGPYAARLALEYARVGITRSFFYELQDQRPEPSLTDNEMAFGLVRNDGSPKPSYLSLQALLTTLADPGAPVADREVRVGLAGAPDDLRQMAFARRDGSTDLVLWRAASLWDVNAKQDLTVPAVDVQLSTESSTEASVVRTGGDTSRQSLGSGSSFSLSVDASPIIVRLASTGSETPPVPEPTVPVPPTPDPTVPVPPTPDPTVPAPTEPAPVESGVAYTVQNPNSGRCVDATGESTADGTQLISWNCHGGDNQRWMFEPTDDGYYRVMAGHAPKLGWDIDASVDGRADRAKAQLWTYGGGDNQQWRIVAEGDGEYHFVARHSGGCLDIAQASKANGALLQQYQCNATVAQSFTITPATGR